MKVSLPLIHSFPLISMKFFMDDDLIMPPKAPLSNQSLEAE
jgi:hypothetical protein